MSYLLCIDIGSSFCKTVIYDSGFKEIGKAHLETTTYHPSSCWAEQKPEEWWKAAVYTARKAISLGRIDPNSIAGVAVCGQGHGPVLLDEKGNSLFPCIVWSDLRAIKQAEYLSARVGKNISPYYTGPKLRWIKEKHPTVFEKMHKFVLPKDYIRVKLAGSIHTDIGDATGTMMYSRKESKWDYPLLDAVGITQEKLPEIHRPEDVTGEVTDYAAAEIGLPKGIPVITGTPDYYGTQNGLGTSLQRERAIAYLGSAPSIFMLTENGEYKGHFMGIAGASLKWFRENLCSASNTFTLRDMDREATKVEPGSDGVIFFPHVMGERSPKENPYARAAFFGLSLGHSRGNIVRAMMEGIVFQMTLVYDSIRGKDNVEEILAIGGGAKSDLWRQMIADVFNVPVLLPDRDEITSLGSAVLLAKGLGIYKEISEAQERAKLRIVDKKVPLTENHEKYKKVLELYRKIENSLSVFFTSDLEDNT